MAHEQLVGQKWTNCTDDIPTTDPELCLASIDISDPLHPILRRPGAPKAKNEALEPSSVQADSSSSPKNMKSVDSDSAACMSGRIFMTSRTSAMDGSWTIDVRTAIMDVSGQVSVDEHEHSNVRGYMANTVRSGGQAETVAQETESAARDNE